MTICTLLMAASVAVAGSRPTPSPILQKRLAAGIERYGIVHFTVNTFTDREWGYGDEDPALFNPTAFDADQIVGACRDGGLQGLIIVAKHHDGFCLWPTKTTEHNISKSPFRGGKGDYVKEMAEACRRHGLKFGVYCSPWDRNNAAYATPEYVKTYHAQVEELNDGRYGEIFEMWFDGANGGDGYYGGAWEKRSIGVAAEYYGFARLLRRVRELQPDVCFFGGGGDGFRWPGNESGIVPPDSGATRDDGTFRVYEADFPLRPGWFYHASQDGFVRSGEFLMKIYLRTVGNAATMNVGIAPDRRGRLTDEDAGSLKRFEEIRTAFFSEPVASAAESFNVIEMTEDVTSGERIDAWRLLLDGRELASGGKIGMKRIRVLERPVSGRELRLEVTKGDADPGKIGIRLFAADEALVRRVLASTEPNRAPAPYERLGVLTSRRPLELVYMMKHPAEVSSLVLTPDVAALGGTPVVFRLAYSADGTTWTEDPVEHRLDNVAANPIAQTVEFENTVTVKYLKLRVVRTLEPGVPAALKGVEFPFRSTSIGSLPVACRSVRTVDGGEASLLPEGKDFKLVWHDEFDGTALDASKWSYRTNFWGRPAHWFAKPEDGCVEVKDGLLRLKVKKLANGQFVSPQLQTGEIMWDVPAMENPKGFWWLGKRMKPLFAHKYGYYECRCRLQRKAGWWSAFWMQTEMQGACLDPGLAGIEQDIMESFDPGKVIPAAFHTNGYGPDYLGFHIPAGRDAEKEVSGKYNLDVDTENFHVFGLLWEPDGYSIYVDGRFRGKNGKAVSHIPEFVLLTTECKWYRKDRMTGPGVSELEEAVAAGDDFVVDYVRVYDLVGNGRP